MSTDKKIQIKTYMYENFDSKFVPEFCASASSKNSATRLKELNSAQL